MTTLYERKKAFQDAIKFRIDRGKQIISNDVSMRVLPMNAFEEKKFKWDLKFYIYIHNFDKENAIKYHEKIKLYEMELMEKFEERKLGYLQDDYTTKFGEGVLIDCANRIKEAYEDRARLLSLLDQFV